MKASILIPLLLLGGLLSSCSGTNIGNPGESTRTGEIQSPDNKNLMEFLISPFEDVVEYRPFSLEACLIAFSLQYANGPIKVENEAKLAPYPIKFQEGGFSLGELEFAIDFPVEETFFQRAEFYFGPRCDSIDYSMSLLNSSGTHVADYVVTFVLENQKPFSVEAGGTGVLNLNPIIYQLMLIKEGESIPSELLDIYDRRI